MAAAYREILRALPTSFRDELRGDQRVWVRRLRIECPAKNPQQVQYLQSCILTRENARTDALKSMIDVQNGITFAWHNVFHEDPGEPGAADPGEGPGSLEASWPEALSNSPEWTAWNRAVADKTYVSEGLAPPNLPIPQVKDWKASPGADESVTTSLDFANSQFVATTITLFWDGHGAHPSTHWIQFNWTLQQKRDLRPEDIFRPDSGWADLLYSLTDQYLDKALDDYDPADLGRKVHEITANPVNWRIDEKGISIVFQQYAVGCYACTPEPFTISWQQLRPLLNPDFIIPAKR